MRKLWKKTVAWVVLVVLLIGNVENVQAEQAFRIVENETNLENECEEFVDVTQTVYAASYPSIQLAVPYYPQKASGDCGISSIAMIEAYALGYGKGDFDTVYSAVYAANGYSYWIDAACSNGKYIDIDMSPESYYQQLAAGNPILIRREPYDHWSVIVGYEGSATNLEESGFIVWDTKGGVSACNYNEITYGRKFDLSKWLKAPDWNGNSYVDRGSTNLVRARVRGTGAIGGSSSGGGSTISYTITDTGTTEITETSARINFTISPTANIIETGFYYGTSPDSMAKVVENYSGQIISNTYQLGTGKWTGALTPGTQYYYKMYMVLTDGTVCESQIGSFTTGGTAPSPSAYTITDTGTTEITETTARINFTVSPMADIIETGFYYGVSPSNMAKVVENYSGQIISNTYQLGTGKWTGALTPGTQYYYKMYMVLTNGTVCESQIGTFTTSGTYDAEAPNIQNVQITDLDATGYTVTCDVTDNVGVTHVAFPTWTEANGQDDIINPWPTVYAPSWGNTYTYRVNISDHNNEDGVYTTHIYAYDAAGNSSTGGVTVTVDKDVPFPKPDCVNHVLIKVEEIAPTCTVEGTYDYWICNNCGRKYSDADGLYEISAESDLVIPKLNHYYQGIYTAPTCTKEGYTTFTCTLCGDSYVSNITSPLGHIWDEGEVLTEATMDKEGTIRYTCVACGISYTENVPAQCRVLAIPAQNYTGKAIKPTLIVYDGTTRLTLGKDYTVKYSNNTKVGTATATIQGKGNYQGAKTVTFTILPQNLNASSVTTEAKYAIATDKVQKLLPTVKWNGKALKKDTDYIVTYPSDGAGAYKEPGTYVIHVEAKEGANFVGGFDVPFTIAEKNTVLASKLTVKAAAATYTGAPIETSVTVKKGSKLLTED